MVPTIWIGLQAKSRTVEEGAQALKAMTQGCLGEHMSWTQETPTVWGQPPAPPTTPYLPTPTRPKIEQ